MSRTLKVVSLAAIVAVGVAASIFIMARPVDGRLAACGATATNFVDTSFDIPAANRIWEFVPGLQDSPELVSDSAPAFVVLFEGDFTSPFGGQPLQGQAERGPIKYHDVMCVVQADGTVNVYADVPRDGLKTP